MRADEVGPRENTLLERLGDQVLPLSSLLRTRMDNGALTRLVDRGLVQVSGVTPSDASHVLGRVDAWDSSAARKALELVSRKRVGSGDVLAKSPEQLAGMIVDQLTEQTSLTLLETAFAEEGHDFGVPPQDLARHVLTRRGLAGHRGLLSLDTALNVDVVGLGASAPSYYPAVGERLRCRMILPEHTGVANAIGAVVGRLTLRRSGTVTSPAEGRYRVHLDSGPQDFAASDQALALLEAVLKEETETAVREAGAEDIRVIVDRDIKTARIEAQDVFVEALVTVEASGRPRVATG